MRKVERQPEPGTSSQSRAVSSGTGAIDPAWGSIRTSTPSAAASSTRQDELLDADRPRRGGSSAQVTPGRTVMPRMPSSSATRTAAENSRRRCCRWGVVTLVGRDLLHRLADREEEVPARQPVLVDKLPTGR